MNDYHDKIQPHSIDEIESLKKRVEELEQSEFKYKHAEQILKANEIKLRNIIEYSSNLLYSHTPDHELTYLSPRTREFFDCEPDEARIRWTEFLTENPNNEIGLILTEKAIETGKIQPSYELELVGKKGRKLWVEVNEAPVIEGGQTVAIVGALTDITERKNAEKALKESELRYRRLFEDSPVPLWEEDFSELKKYLDDLKEKGIKDFLKYFNDYPDEVNKCVLKIKVLDVNKATLQLFKANNKEDLISNSQKLFTENSYMMFKNEIIAFANGATNIETEAIAKTLIGKERNVLIEFQVPKDENEELDYLHVLLSTSDITPLKRAEEAISNHLKNILALHQASLAFSRLLNVQDVGHSIVETLEKILDWHRGSIWIMSESGKELDLLAHTSMGFDKELFSEELNRVQGLVKLPGDGISGWVALHGKPVRTGNVKKDPRYIVADTKIQSELCVPMSITGRTIGSINVESTESNAFDENDERLLSILASQAAIAIENARLFGKIQQELTERKQAEEVLQESEEKYRLLFESIPEAITTIDEQGTIISVNKSVKRILGYEPSELLGKSVDILAPEELRSEQKENIIKAIKKGFLESQETIRVAKDGTRIPIDISVFTSKDSTGNLLGVSAVMRDITERKLAEKELKEEKNYLGKLLDSLGEGIFTVELPDRIIISVNKAAKDVFGYDSNAVIGKTTEMLYPDEKSYKEFGSKLKGALEKSEDVFHTQLILKRKNGEQFPAEITTSFIKENGEARQVISIVRDVTERKKAEEKLKISEESYRGLFDNAIDAIYILDTRGRFIDVNRGAIEMYGYPKEYFVGKTPKSLSAPGKNDWKKINEHIRKAFKGEPQQFEFWAVKSNGEFFPKLIRLQKGSYFGKDVVIIFALDITEREQAEKEIERLSRFPDENPDPVLRVNIEGTVYYANIASDVLLSKWKTSVGDKLPVSLMQSMTDIIAASGKYKFEETCDEKVFEIRCVPIENYGYINLYARDITERKQTEEALQNIAVSFSAVSGEEFFNKVSDYLADKLNIDYAFIGELVEEDKVRVVGGVGKGDVLKPFEYDLKNTPCENVMGQSLCCYISGVQKLFPKDPLLVEMGIDGYLGSPLFDNSGKVAGIIVLLNEKPITNQKIAESTLQIFSDRVSAEIQRKQAEEALREKEEKQRMILKNIDEIVYMFSINEEDPFWGTVQFVSHKVQNIIGYESDEFVNDPALWFKLLHPDDIPGLKQNTRKILASKKGGNREYRLRHKNTGEYRWMEDRAVPQLDDSGKVVGIFGVARDITERKLMEEEMRRLDRGIEAAGESIIMTDPEGNIQYVNPAFTRLTGYPAEEVVGQNPRILKSGRHPHEFYQQMWDTTLRGEIWSGEVVNRRKDGTLYEAILTIASIFDQRSTLEGFVAVQRDITERKQAEEALKNSEKKYQVLYDNAPDMYVSVDPHTAEILQCNQTLMNNLGYTREEIIGRSIFEMYHPDCIDDVKKAFQAFVDTGEVHNAELQLKGKDGSEIDVMLNVSAVRDEQGNILYSQTSWRDITQRKQAEKALHESENKYRTLFEQSADAILTIEDNKFVDCNPATLKMLGYANKKELLQTHPSQLSPEMQPDGRSSFEKANEMMSIAFDRGSHRFEWDHKRRNGEVFPVEVLLTAIPYKEGNFLHVVWRDITERKQAAKELRESEEKLRAIFDSAADGIVETDLSGNMLKVNKAVLRIYGSDSEEDFIGKSSLEFFAPSEKIRVLKVYRKTYYESIAEDSEFEALKIDGTSFSVQITSSLLHDDNGNPIGFVGVIKDITERKQAERALRDSEYLLRESQKVANLGSYVLDIPGGIWKSSLILDDIFGIDKKYNKDVSGWLQIVHPEDRAMMQDYFATNMLTNHESFNKEYRIKRINDQQERWVHGVGELEFNDDGNPIKMIGTIQDITERKLVQSRAIGLAHILESSLNEIYIFDAKTLRFIQVNRGARENLGYSQDELKNRTALDIKPEFSRESLENLIAPLRTGERNIINFETTHKRKDGSLYPVDVHLQLTTLEDKSVFLAIILDITVRKKAEEEIRKLSHSVEQSPAIVMITDTEGIIEYVNSKFIKVTGYTVDDVLGKNPKILKSDEMSREEYEVLWKTIKAGGEWRGEFHNKKKNGELYWESASITALKDSNGQITHFVAVKEDITERKRAEEALQESQAKWRSITENSPDQIMMLDKDTNILFINRTVSDLTKEEVVGKSVYNFVPSVFHRRARECFENVLRSGKPGSYEIEKSTKDGETQYFSVSVGPVYRGGEITALVSSSTDITKQKRIEEKLKGSYVRLQSLAARLQMIREEERASVAREIHDDLGQSLTALKMDISWMKNNPEMNERAKENKFDIMLDLINSTIQTVKRIATQLRPGILDDLGLVSAIEWQADEFQKRFRVKCNFTVNKKDGVVSNEIGIAVFRIFQETLTNVARHSGATVVDINLNFRDDGFFVMDISDNGVGIDEDQVRSSQSFGLFGMRERVNILKGEMEIVGEHGKGTKVRVSIPVLKEEMGNNK